MSKFFERNKTLIVGVGAVGLHAGAALAQESHPTPSVSSDSAHEVSVNPEQSDWAQAAQWLHQEVVRDGQVAARGEMVEAASADDPAELAVSYKSYIDGKNNTEKKALSAMKEKYKQMKATPGSDSGMLANVEQRITEQTAKVLYLTDLLLRLTEQGASYFSRLDAEETKLISLAMAPVDAWDAEEEPDDLLPANLDLSAEPTPLVVEVPKNPELQSLKESLNSDFPGLTIAVNGDKMVVSYKTHTICDIGLKDNVLSARWRSSHFDPEFGLMFYPNSAAIHDMFQQHYAEMKKSVDTPPEY